MSELPKLPQDALGPSEQPTLYERSLADAQNRDDAWLAKAAVFAAGIHGLGRLMGKNVYAEMADVLGSASRNLAKYGKPVQNIPSYITEDLYYSLGRNTPGAVLKNGIKLDSIPLIQDIAEATYLADSPAHRGYFHQLDEVFKENFNNLRKSATKDSVLHKELSPITVQDVLDSARDILGDHVDPNDYMETKLLSHAVKRGWLTTEQVLDPNLYKTASGKILDTRIFRPNQFLESAANVVNPFGLFKALHGFTSSDRTIGSISSSKPRSGDALFVGGKTFEYEEGKLLQTGSNKTLGLVNDSRYTAALLREQDSTVQKIEPTNFWERVQDYFGVGPKYHERRTGAIQTARSFFKNLKDVASGEAEFYSKEYKYAHESVFQKIAEPYTYYESIEHGEIVKGKFALDRFPTKESLTPKTGIFRRTRGALNRFKAYAGLSDDLVIVRKDAANRARGGGSRISKADFNVDFGRSGIKSTENVIGISRTPTNLTLTGDLEFNVRAKHYASSQDLLDRVYDFSNWMTLRLNKLASASMLGIGFKPSGNLLANTARVASIPMLYHFGKEGIMYGNYLIGQIIGQGPIEYAADIYTNLRVGQQKAREKLGITDFAKKFENQLFPGLDLGVLGSIGSALAGILTTEKSGSFIKGLLASGALYATVGGPDVSQSSDSLKREYSGEEKVPVRKNRWWLLGYQPFKGGQIDYYKPSWYTELKTKPYDVSIYGSEKGYWKHGSDLPTPSNWFYLRNFIDPYYTERVNYYDRPYPTTAKMFEEVPLFGPLLADTIGEVIKPTKRMHEDTQAYMVASSNISDKGVPTNAARELGIPDLPVTAVNLRRPDIAKDRLQKYANVALEPTGVWKFALGLFGVTFDQDYKLASANNITSPGRRFYNKNLGGAFGETEFVRRFMLADYNTASKINLQINPVTNIMPRWLPGTESENEKDKDYFIDFTKGDAYTKIPNGEFRLPGRGYESVNKLYSGVSGVYSDVDKYLILADVAPFSQAFYRYQGIVNQKQLSPYWKWKVSQAEEQRQTKLIRFDFQTSSSQDQLAKLNESKATRAVRKTWTAFQEEGLANIPIIGAKLFPYRNAYDQYLADVVEGDTFADWRSPYETIIRPAFFTTVGENPLFAAKRGFNIGTLASSNAAAFLNPFPILTANPVAAQIGGAAIGGVGSTIRMIGTGSTSHGYVPSHVEKEREVSQYFDYIKYAKYRSLQSQAKEQGRPELASIFASQARQTVTYGLAQYATTGRINSYQSALSRDERPYFDAFIQAPAASREKILKIVPKHMQTVLQGIWNNRQTNVQGNNAYAIADESALQYFDNHNLPNDNWEGWHPSVPEAAIKIKALTNHINGVSDNMHRFGIYPAQVQEAIVRFPELDAPTNINDQSQASVSLIANNLMAPERGNPFSNVYSRRVSHGTGPRIDWFTANIEDSKRDKTFAFYNDAYR